MRRLVVDGDAGTMVDALTGDGWSVRSAGDGPVDLLLIVATTPPARGRVTETDDVTFVETFERVASRSFRVARDLWPSLRATGGSIVIVTSVSGLRGDHAVAARSVASAAAIAVMELLAAEGADVGVRANAICVADEPTALGAVAETIAWLARPGVAAISGAAIRVDGAAGAALRADTRA